MDENNLFKIMAGLSTVLVAIAGFFMRKHDKKFNDIELIHKDLHGKHDKLRDSHHDLQLVVSEKYAKKEDLLFVRQETKETLERIHTRLDDLPQTILNLLKK